MTTICQNVGILTTTTLRTISTIFVTTSTQQMAGRPITSTVYVANPTCRTAGSGNSSTVMCATSTQTSVVVVTPPGTQVQVPITVTNQYVSTQLNTLFGSVCRAGPGQPTPDGYTDTTYTTEYFTVTGSGPTTTPDPTPIPTPTPTTTGSFRSTLSRNTVYGAGNPTSEPGASDTALGAGSGSSASSKVPVGAIVGGVVGGLVAAALLGFLVYYLVVKKPLAAKGYKAPGEESPYHDTEHSDVFSSEQTGYYAQGYDGSGQGYPSGPQNQGLGGAPTQPQGSYPMQYADMGSQGAQHFQPQDVAGNTYAGPEPQGPQYLSQTEMGQVPFNTSSGAAFPVAFAAGAGAGVGAGVGATLAASSLSHHRYSSSSSPPPGSSGQYSPASHISTVPLIHQGSPHQPQPPLSHTPVPYRGYAEPADG